MTRRPRSLQNPTDEHEKKNANSEQIHRKEVGHYDGTSWCLYQLRMTDSKIKDNKLPFIRKQIINIHNRKSTDALLIYVYLNNYKVQEHK